MEVTAFFDGVVGETRIAIACKFERTSLFIIMTKSNRESECKELTCFLRSLFCRVKSSPVQEFRRIESCSLK